MGKTHSKTDIILMEKQRYSDQKNPWNEQRFSIQTLTCSTWERREDTAPSIQGVGWQGHTGTELHCSGTAQTAKHYSAFSHWCSWTSLIRRCLQGFPPTAFNPVHKHPTRIFLPQSLPFAKELHSPETKNFSRSFSSPRVLTKLFPDSPAFEFCSSFSSGNPEWDFQWDSPTLPGFASLGKTWTGCINSSCYFGWHKLTIRFAWTLLLCSSEREVELQQPLKHWFNRSGQRRGLCLLPSPLQMLLHLAAHSTYSTWH